MAKVLVLGCGPAGLLAAHAATIADHQVEIISKKEKSFIAGAQFLHSAIPWLTGTEPDGVLNIEHVGTEEGYALKVYGDADAQTSWSKFSGETPVWNLQRWYELLWARYSPMIMDDQVTPAVLDMAVDFHDVVLSTIPVMALFPEGEYKTRTVRILDFNTSPRHDMQIIYSGAPNHPWYRTSSIFGYASTEYGPSCPDIPAQAKLIKKPLSSSFENPHPNLHLLGRYGKWEKGVLVDDAFREAREICSALHHV